MLPTLLFDMDGTIVETDHLHFAAFQTILAPHGVELDWATFRSFVVGRSAAEVAARLVPHLPVSEHGAFMDGKEAAYRSLIGTLAPAEGLMDLLDWADAEGIACAIVTNAPRASAEHVLAALGIASRFRTLVIGDETGDPKPHPRPYLTALERLGGEAACSVAFEDSGSGVTSAAAAGLPVVGITSALDPNDLRGKGARLLIENYRDPFLMPFLRLHLGLDAPPDRLPL